MTICVRLLLFCCFLFYQWPYKQRMKHEVWSTSAWLCVWMRKLSVYANGTITQLQKNNHKKHPWKLQLQLMMMINIITRSLNLNTNYSAAKEMKIVPKLSHVRFQNSLERSSLVLFNSKRLVVTYPNFFHSIVIGSAHFIWARSKYKPYFTCYLDDNRS